jgi:hypothetical protein
MTDKTKHRHWYWLGLCLPGVIPFVASYLPFQDWPGHLGVVGVMLHFDEPSARLSTFYEYTGGWKPNSLLYWMIYGFGRVLSPMNAGRVVMGLGLAGLGPALAMLCRQVDADDRLAYFALPLAIGRHVYCGFIPNACGLVFGVLALAAYFACKERPRRWRLLTLLVLLWFTHAFHVFVFLAVAGLILAASLWDVLETRQKPQALTLGVVVFSFVSMLPHLSMFDTRSGTGPGFFGAVLSAMRKANHGDLLRVFWDWLFASYRYQKLDDVLQGVWLVLLLVSLIMAIRTRDLDPARKGVRRRLYLMSFLTGLMFVLLPSYVGPPVNWWGGNLRLPVLLSLVLIPLAGRCWAGRDNLYRGIIILNVGVCVLAAGDLWNFSRTEMRGFSEVIEAIPAGQRVTLLHWTPEAVHEYPGEPHGYASNYYLLQKGGFVPQNVFEHPDVLVQRKNRGAAPPWGQAEYFDWNRHSAGYEGFVVRRHPKYEHSPLHGVNQTRVELVKRSGSWAYYRRRP